ncbi:MAG: cytochrome c/FTR1 family iron permease [Acidobacteriota bacterium]|nr:cytochrome c/FTR1 family iron permease [Acidobacteriota bacterium]
MLLIRRLFPVLTFLPIVIGVAVLFVPAGGAPEAGPPSTDILVPEDPDRLEPERLVFLLQYLGTDYAAAVQAGQVVSDFEYQEMLEFSRLLLEQYRQLDPDSEILSGLEEARQMIQEKRDWAEVRSLTQGLLPKLSEQLNVISYPNLVPDLSRGEELYRANCEKCHGVNGDGSGPSATDLDPAPRSFLEERMNQLAPHQIYNAVSFGVEGTEMPSHLESLRDPERWDVAFFVFTFRQGFTPVLPERPLPLSLKDLATHTSEELVSRFSDQGREVRIAHIDYYRQNPPGASLEELLLLAEQKLQKGKDAYQGGNPEQALRFTLDAYLEGVEPVEPALRQRNRALATQLETEFWRYRMDLRSGAPAAAIDLSYQSLRVVLGRSREALENSEAESGFAFLQSLTIILREGIEAALLLGLMVTYLAVSGYGRLRKYVGLGAAAGILLGIVTWWVFQVILALSPLQQEALEGITSLLAAAVLFSVTFWVIHQIDIRSWKEYIRKKAEEAVGTGRGLTLASVAFLVVYREAVETVLFYQALWMRSSEAQAAVVLGFISGTAVLAALVFLMFKFGVRIPLKPFFSLTGILLGLLAFVFAGYGVRELQTIGWIKETPLLWVGSLPLLEIRPTLETCVLQFGIVASILIGWLLLTRKPLTTDHRP